MKHSVDLIPPKQAALLITQLRRLREQVAPESHVLRPRAAAVATVEGGAARPQTVAAPLSFSQQRLWLLDRLEPGASAYNVPLLLRLSGSLDRQALIRSFQEIVRRHHILRTAFREDQGQLLQIVLPRIDLGLPTIDLSGLPAHEQERELLRWTQELATEGFDLSCPPLLRLALLALGPSNHHLLVVMHHIVSDGWSLGILLRELGALYTAFQKGRPSPLPELPVQYADFAIWQRRWLTGYALEEQLAWWRQLLDGAPPLLELPTDRPRPPVQSFRGSACRFTFDTQKTEALTVLGQREGATLFMVLLASWAAVLSRLAGQEDLLLGAPIAGRTRREFEGLIGFFVNTLVLRANLQGDPTFRELIARVREVSLGAFTHQDVPFEKLVEELALERALDHPPLFQTMLVLQNVPGGPLSVPDLTMTPLTMERAAASYDLELYLQERGDRVFEGVLRYNTDLFDGSTAARILERFQLLIEGAVTDPACRVGDLPLLTEAERLQMMSAGSHIAAPLAEPLLYRRFQAQAALRSEEVALIQGERRFTFGEINLRAERLAARLATLGVGPEIVVGLCLERSPELVVAALAVLAAGGAYLPLDTSQPQERQTYFLSDARVSLVLASETWPGVPAGVPALILPRDLDLAAAGSIQLVEPSPENLAYVLYTSGSTGRPKGVMVQQRALTRYLDWAIQAYELEVGHGVPVHSSLAFDMTVTSLWAPLVAGRTVTLLPEERGIEGLAATIRPGAGFSLVKLTPAHLDLLAQHVSPESVAGWTRVLVVGGEALRKESIAFWREHAPETRILNEYGPTETVVGCSVYELPRELPAAALLPIGLPIAGARLYVLDRSFRIVPMGVAGELWIGGEGVTRGYLGRPDLTAERFLPDPFSPEPGARIYRSADLTRWGADGTLHYLGRSDHQIKIRGFRIELGEIEATLESYAGVRESVVLAREGHLVAFLAGQALPSAHEVRDFLARRLPEYMLPAVFVGLEALPLMPNGKVDRRALAGMPLPRSEETPAHVAPRTPIEELLANIWSEVLGLERVGVEANFFSLGGHSLSAAQLLSRMRRVFDTDVPLRAIFEAPTIAGLAQRVERELTQLSSDDPRLLWKPHDTQASIDAIYDEMRALVERHGSQPGLRQALRPLREKLQTLQEIEAQEIAARYDSHFRPDYETAKSLIQKAYQSLRTR